MSLDLFIDLLYIICKKKVTYNIGSNIGSDKIGFFMHTHSSMRQFV